MSSTKNNLTVFLYLFSLIMPVFVNLDVSAGINLSVDPFNKTGYSSLPISVFIVALMCLRSFLKVAGSIQIIFYFLFVIVLLELNMGFVRQLYLLFGMLLPFVVLALFQDEAISKGLFNNLRLSVYFLVLMKFLVDIFFDRGVSSNVFLFSGVVIYNYYDYFPVLYAFIATLCVYSLLRNTYSFLSAIVFLICTLFVFHSESRLAQILILLIPCNFLITKVLVSQLFFKIYALLLLMVCLLITIAAPFLLDGITDDASMLVRFEHWSGYWDSYSIINIVFPNLNEYRGMHLGGTLHHEPLEIFSYFGVFGLFYYFVIIKLLASCDVKYRFLSVSLLTIIIIGGLFQSNLSNSYLSVIFGLFIASFNANRLPRIYDRKGKLFTLLGSGR